MNISWTLCIATCSLLFLALAETDKEEPSTTSSSQCGDTNNLKQPTSNPNKREAPTKESMCECAAFNKKLLVKTDTPILTQKTIKINCTKEGEETCAKLCIALARASKEQGPSILCKALGHYDNFTVSMFSTRCDQDKWVYTGLTSSESICCHDHKFINCKSPTRPKE